MDDKWRFERLEDRRLLAVSVRLGVKRGVLAVTGDADMNDVDIEGSGGVGNVEVLVGGVSVDTFVGVKSIRVNLGGGNDTLGIAAVNIPGSITADMGAGADVFELDNLGLLHNGAVQVGGSVTVTFGGNMNDVADWNTNLAGVGITVGNNVVLAGAAKVNLNGNGGSSVVQATDVTIGGALKVGLNGTGAGVTLDLDDVNVGGASILNGSLAADSIQVTYCRFARRVDARLGGGDDLLDIDGGGMANSFFGPVVFDFGVGVDTLDASGGNSFFTPPVNRNGPENPI
jgi:hypothetical protein